jgi:hypothetical protein
MIPISQHNQRKTHIEKPGVYVFESTDGRQSGPNSVQSVSTTPLMLDELVQGQHVVNSSHPVGATTFARRLLLARTSLAVGEMTRATVELTAAATQGLKDLTKFDIEKLDHHMWVGEWTPKFFAELWILREELGLLGDVMNRNIGLLQRLNRRLNVKKDSKTAWEREQVEIDLDEWQELEASRTYAYELMGRTKDAYLETIATNGAQFANAQAMRQVIAYSKYSRLRY